jgi:sugar phosphate isomerase/epimerase
MAIKLAFSTVACPEWSLEEAAKQASAMGYQGLELRTLDAGPTGGALASDPALSEPAKVRATLKAAGVEAVCLSTSIALHHADTTAARHAMNAAEAAVERAAAIGAPMVRFFGNELRPGDLRQACQTRIAERLKHLAERGMNAGVQVLVENGGSFAKSKEWWWIFNLVDHPMAGVCWNVANAAAAGESSAVSVTTLNSRIRLAKVKDTFVGEGTGFVQLGDGTVGIEMFIKRLLGIGYDGYITAEWDRVWLPTLAPASEYLPEAHKRLKGWLDEVAQAIEDAKPKPKKAAAAH